MASVNQPQSSTASPARASVLFEAPHGTEAVELWDGDVAEFGRAISCTIRFGYAPIADLHVPRVAGRILVAGGRVHVEAQADAKPLEIEPESGPQVLIAVDEAHSCRARNFTVVVPGHPDPWFLHVGSRSDEIVRRLAGPDPQTAKLQFELSDLDWTVLRAYAKPLLDGGVAIATHAQVANELGRHVNTVRNRMYALCTRMHSAGLTMPTMKNDVVGAAVRGARLHGLL